MANKEKDQKKTEVEEQPESLESGEHAEKPTDEKNNLSLQLAVWEGVRISAQQTLNILGMGQAPNMITTLQNALVSNENSIREPSEKELENVYKEARKVIFGQIQEEKELELRKERAIIELMEKSEEVEIEEMGDSNKAFGTGVSINQNGGGAHIGTEKGVSYYRRYKFKRGGQTKEISDSSDESGEEEK